MDSYTLKWPSDFEDYAWQLDSKGWFTGLDVMVDDRVLRPTFYDPVRLAQEIASGLSTDDDFVEPLLIVVRQVTRESMEAAIADLARTGQLGRWLRETGHSSPQGNA